MLLVSVISISSPAFFLLKVSSFSVVFIAEKCFLFELFDEGELVLLLMLFNSKLWACLMRHPLQLKPYQQTLWNIPRV